MGKLKIAILICAYNEEKTIKKIVNSAIRYGEVFVIDDGSTDNTSNQIKGLKINYFKNRKNQGYEKSLDKGFSIIKNKKKFDAFVTLDADGQHKISSLKKVIKKLNKFDLVIGSRHEKNNFLEKVLSLITKIKFNLNDVLCGLKAYKINKFYDNNFQSDLIGTDLIFFGIKKKVIIREVAINSGLRVSGKSRYYAKISNYRKIFKLILKILLF